MEFIKMAFNIFGALPDFKDYFDASDETLDKDSPYLFLSGFGIFVSDAIVHKKAYASSSLEFINRFVNDNVEDKELMEMMVVGVLEILTDYSVTQKEASKNFTDHCYKFFDELLTGGYFVDLRQITY